MKILVFGGTGAMGKYLVRELAKSGHNVAVTTRSVSDKRQINNSVNVKYIQGDAHDNEFLKNLMRESWDAVVDFMAYSTAEFEARYKFLLGNTGRLIFLSSARVYANSTAPLTEDSPRLLEASEDIKYLATDE